MKNCTNCRTVNEFLAPKVGGVGHMDHVTSFPTQKGLGSKPMVKHQVFKHVGL
jgi:hypothetical protein